jgi:two-component system sensor histidine kinase SenX3
VIGAVAVLLFVRTRPAPPPAAARSFDVDGELTDVLQSVFAGLASAVVVLDRNDDVVLLNPAAEALNIVTRRRLTLPALSRMVALTRRSGDRQEAQVEQPSEREHTALLARTAFAGDQGHVLVLVEDITDARRLEAVRRDFVANVSHELKTPVGALSLLGEAVTEAADDPERVRHFALKMRREAERLARLVQELLDLSRVQGADPMPEPAVVPVTQFGREAVDRVQHNADARGMRVVVGNMAGLRVWGDARQLATACANLLDNAIAYSPDGTRVAVGAQRAGEFVEVSVVDQGIGISPEDRERIFERFYRADPARSRATGGTGLGLAIVKHIAGNHGGRVTVWSDEGAGSTFTLHLPASIEGARAGGDAA